MGQPLIRVEITADSEANAAVELRDQRDGRRLERQPALVEFVPGSEDAEEYAPKFRPGSVFELA